MSLPMPSIKMDPDVMQEMDAPFVQIAQASGGDLRKLMFAFFSFLHRRTDFYCVPHESDVMGFSGGGQHHTIGFKEGDAEKLLLAAFRQFPLRRMPKQNRSPGADPPGKITPTNASSSSSSSSTKDGKNIPSIGSTTSQASLQEKIGPQKTVEGIRKSVHEDPMESTRFTDEGLQVPVGNGGATPKFRWTQTLDEVTVILAPPEGTRGKDMTVDIKKLAVSVTLKNAVKGNDDDNDNEGGTLLSGTLHDFIVPSESTWSLEGGVMLLVLQKAKKTWWECAFVGDPKIDTTLVDSRRRIDEYDGSTQGAIRRILFDQHQERLGKPTSEKILRAKGENPIPPLPPGVEFIDNETLEKFESQRLSEA